MKITADGTSARGRSVSTVTDLPPILLVVEQALGPGIDFEPDAYREWIGRRARLGTLWLGFDRAALPGSDDGTGRLLRVVVSVPSSTFAGCHLEAALLGGWSIGDRNVLLGALPGMPPPSRAVAAGVAQIAGDAIWYDAAAAVKQAQTARRRFRERQSQERILGGRAWDVLRGTTPDTARYTTPHSVAEYGLSRLPPRFVRGLSSLLDEDERVLYSIHRPAVLDPPVLDRIRRRQHRAAMLVLTDRQLLWLVDHFPPDRYLTDWGVDIEAIPVERIEGAACRMTGGIVQLDVATRVLDRRYTLPAEYLREVGVMRSLLDRFVATTGRLVPRRIYVLERIAFDAGPAARVGQSDEAESLMQQVPAPDRLAFAYSPRRSGQSRQAGVAVTSVSIELVTALGHVAVALADVAGISVTLSPLVARLSTLGAGPRIDLAFPGAFAVQVAALARLARRAIANAPGRQ